MNAHLHHYTLSSWYARAAIADALVIVALILACWWLNKQGEQR